jgi:hypothetical protein
MNHSTRIQRAAVAAAALLLLSSGPAAGEGSATRVLDDFTGVAAGRLPDAWTPRDEKGKPYYAVAEEEGNSFLRATVPSDSVHIYRRVEWDIAKYPVLSWRWRVLAFPPGGDESVASLNDSAGGVYATWVNLLGFSARSIKYVWSATLPAGRTFKVKNTWFVVARSGTADGGKWVAERVNVRDDWRRLWGGDPGDPDLLVILTDSNATRSTVVCDYDDFAVSVVGPETAGSGVRP